MGARDQEPSRAFGVVARTSVFILSVLGAMAGSEQRKDMFFAGSLWPL